MPSKNREESRQAVFASTGEGGPERDMDMHFHIWRAKPRILSKFSLAAAKSAELL